MCRKEEKHWLFPLQLESRMYSKYRDIKECDHRKWQRLILWVPRIPPLSGLFSNPHALFFFSIVSWFTASMYFPWHTFFLTSGGWLVFVMIIWLDRCGEFGEEQCIMKRYLASPETTELNVMQNLCKKKCNMVLWMGMKLI